MKYLIPTTAITASLAAFLAVGSAALAADVAVPPYPMSSPGSDERGFISGQKHVDPTQPATATAAPTNVAVPPYPMGSPGSGERGFISGQKHVDPTRPATATAAPSNTDRDNPQFDNPAGTQSGSKVN